MNEKIPLQIAVGKYHNIINNLIKISFPSLKDKDIEIVESKKLEFSADTKKFRNFLRIRTNSLLRIYSDKLLIGIFSHELSHLEEFINFNNLDDFIYGIKYTFSKNYKKLIEKETDINAIKKGYAGYLYLQRKSRWESTDKKTQKLKEIYLSHGEIKKIATQMKKWPGKYCNLTKKELKV